MLLAGSGFWDKKKKKVGDREVEIARKIDREKERGRKKERQGEGYNVCLYI